MSTFVVGRYFCREKPVQTFFLREYNKTGKKNEWGLRCKDPLLVNEYQLEIFPVLNVNKNDFKAVTKVNAKIQMKYISCFF